MRRRARTSARRRPRAARNSRRWTVALAFLVAGWTGLHGPVASAQIEIEWDFEPLVPHYVREPLDQELVAKLEEDLRQRLPWVNRAKNPPTLYLTFVRDSESSAVRLEYFLEVRKDRKNPAIRPIGTVENSEIIKKEEATLFFNDAKDQLPRRVEAHFRAKIIEQAFLVALAESLSLSDTAFILRDEADADEPSDYCFLPFTTGDLGLSADDLSNKLPEFRLSFKVKKQLLGKTTLKPLLTSTIYEASAEDPAEYGIEDGNFPKNCIITRLRKFEGSDSKTHLGRVDEDVRVIYQDPTFVKVPLAPVVKPSSRAEPFKSKEIRS